MAFYECVRLPKRARSAKITAHGKYANKSTKDYIAIIKQQQADSVSSMVEMVA